MCVWPWGGGGGGDKHVNVHAKAHILHEICFCVVTIIPLTEEVLVESFMETGIYHCSVTRCSECKEKRPSVKGN